MAKALSPLVYNLKELKILDDIREVFYKTTGLAISCHYPGTKDYDFYPMVEKNPYCSAIQECEEGMERCLKSDQDALETARAHCKSCVYTCHAGLMNVVIPLIYKGKDLGALFFGQFVPKDRSEGGFDSIYESLASLGLDKRKLSESFDRVKVFDPKDLTLATTLLTLMANYIVSVEDELCLQSELHEREKEILRYENTQMQLKNDLQKLSIRILEDKMQINSEQSRLRSGSSQKKAIVARAREFIVGNYERDISVADVARAVYLSPNYFSTIFKEMTGEGFSDCLNDIRIQQGKRMLQETDLPIKIIVSRVGFKDYNYFNRTFRRIVGIPPAEYRSSAAGKGGLS